MKLTVQHIVGVIGIVPTPATPDASSWKATATIAVDETRKMVELVVAGGVHIVMTTGTFGECATLTCEEPVTFVDCVVQTVRKRPPVFAGITTLNTRDTITRGRELLDLGADGLFIGRPMWLALDDKGIVRYYQDLAEAMPGVPMVIYDNPLAFKSKISREAYLELAKIPGSGRRQAGGRAGAGKRHGGRGPCHAHPAAGARSGPGGRTATRAGARLLVGRRRLCAGAHRRGIEADPRARLAVDAADHRAVEMGRGADVSRRRSGPFHGLQHSDRPPALQGRRPDRPGAAAAGLRRSAAGVCRRRDRVRAALGVAAEGIPEVAEVADFVGRIQAARIATSAHSRVPGRWRSRIGPLPPSDKTPAVAGRPAQRGPATRRCFDTPSHQDSMLGAQSEIAFTSKQMGVQVNGKFRKFGAQVAFDPKKPEAAKISFPVDLGSATLGSAETEAELIKPDWFNVKASSRAAFQSTSVKSTGAGKFDVSGKLTIKSIAQSVVVPVTLTQSAGTTTAVGGGSRSSDWTSTSARATGKTPRWSPIT